MDTPTARLLEALSDTYVVERELGGGGMSRTFVAVEQALQRQVVIKVLSPELLAGLSVERFRREVLLAARLQHPHIVPVLAAGDVQGLPWFSMPYVVGDSLRQRLTRGALPIAEAVTVLRDVARALAFAHAAGVVHRDIKPDNILLAAGSATVTDFGIAKAVSAARTSRDEASTMLTQAGMSIGTPAYMAPEQAMGDPDTDHRADLYSFGCLAFELLAGRPPFTSAAPSKLIAQHMTEPAADVRTLRPDAPPMLADLIAVCLRKEPNDRPQHADDLVHALDATASGEGNLPAALAGPRLRMTRALGTWAAATAGLVITAWGATNAIGLPDWTLPSAIGVGLAGLPVVLASVWAQTTARRAFANNTLTPGGTPAQAGTMQTLALKASPVLQWTRVRRYGVIAGAGFALFVAGFMVTRALGIGPAASLKGTGAFGDKETLVVADFRSTADSTLGSTVAEALRTDLAQSRALKVLSRQTLDELLRLMQKPGRSLGFDVAREIATREGAKAVLDGEIVRLGAGYVVSARLVSAREGNELATFRRTADSEADLLAAVGDLARDVRGKAGESLKAIRGSSPLERVTTASLPALRKYVEGSEAASSGDNERGLVLLGEAVKIDTAFAMAWRRLSTVLGNEGREIQRATDALETAMRHRDRLTELERAQLEGIYYQNGPHPDYAKALAAYDDALRIDSLNSAALNNSGILFQLMGRPAEAITRYEAATRIPRPYFGSFTNLAQELIFAGRGSEVAPVMVRARTLFGASPSAWEFDWSDRIAATDFAGADSVALATLQRLRTGRTAGSAARRLAVSAFVQGRIADGSRWLTFRDELSLRESGSPTDRFRLVLDTLGALALRPGSAAAFRGMAARVLSMPLLDSVPKVERNWGFIVNLATHVGDAATLRRALDGFARDVAPRTPDSALAATAAKGYLAIVEQRWPDAIRAIEAGMAGHVGDRGWDETLLARAHDAAGRLDSAVVLLEQVTRGIPATDAYDAILAADNLDRLGAMYESQGQWRKAYDATERYIAIRRNADPEHQPALRAARARLERVRAKVG